MHYSLLRYSTEPKISMTDLKSGFLLEDIDCSKVEQWMEKNQISAIMEGDASYTHHRLKVAAKPYIVYYQGNLDLLHRQKLRIVGSRKATSYGKQVMQDLFEQLEGKELVTISGGADGIDELCHTLSIDKGLPTICVLGGGLAYYLAHARRGLFERIVASGGLILSEFRLKDEPTPYTFPQRNRIIAGLSDWLFVPCAAEESGSLITVKDALKARVPVYGTPGSIYEAGQQGINKAIASGDMKAVYDLMMFVDSLGLTKNSEAKQGFIDVQLSEDQKAVYTVLQDGAINNIELLSQHLGKDVVSVSMILTELEMESLVYEERPGIWKSK